MPVPVESAFFDLWAPSYDRPGLQHTTYRPVHDAVLARLADANPHVVLDLGCGTGQLAARLRDRFSSATIIGVDLSNVMLEHATERADEANDANETNQADGANQTNQDDPSDTDVEPGLHFVRADAQHLPLADGSIDVVVCTESFHWYHDQEAAVAELRRLTTPGARLIIASIAAVTGVGDDVLRTASSAAGRPIKAIAKRRLRQLLETADFTVDHQRRIARLGFVPWPMLTDATRV